MPSARFVIPIQVGTALAAQRLPMLHDDTGDNISVQNRHYSELTACYWIWKNADRSASDAWGLCHYRRYFSWNKYKLLFKQRSRFYRTLTQENLDAVVNARLYKELQFSLATNDLVIQKPVYAHKQKSKIFTLEEAYKLAHHQQDWDTTLEVIRELYPAYSGSLQDFSWQTKMSYYNMMVARWQLWDEYLEWLFAILFEVQKRITVSNDPYQTRVFGFLSERLLNLYIQHNNLRVSYSTIALFEK